MVGQAQETKDSGSHVAAVASSRKAEELAVTDAQQLIKLLQGRPFGFCWLFRVTVTSDITFGITDADRKLGACGSTITNPTSASVSGVAVVGGAALLFKKKEMEAALNVPAILTVIGTLQRKERYVRVGVGVAAPFGCTLFSCSWCLV